MRSDLMEKTGVNVNVKITPGIVDGQCVVRGD